MVRKKFVLKTISRYFSKQDRSCPNCGGFDTERIGRKKVLLEIIRCKKCMLIFRFPKDEHEESIIFYQNEYDEGLTTRTPDPDTLKHYLKNNFRGSDIDISEKIEIVRRFRKSGKVLDYGCSWGYGVYQFLQAGFDAIGYEISTERASYGVKHIGVEILNKSKDLLNLPKASFDVIFANHVLEHITNINATFQDFQYLINRNGIVIVFVPNGGGFKAMNLGYRWGPFIGEKHPVALDAIFFSKNMPRFNFLPQFDSSPYDSLELKSVNYEEPYHSSILPGSELLVVANCFGE